MRVVRTAVRSSRGGKLYAALDTLPARDTLAQRRRVEPKDVGVETIVIGSVSWKAKSVEVERELRAKTCAEDVRRRREPKTTMPLKAMQRGFVCKRDG